MELATHRIPGLVLVDHAFTVPLDHDHPDHRSITVFAREVRAPVGGDDRPWLVFFQGGPGFESPRPSDGGGWIGRAIADYRVLLLDQRGTGRSTVVLPETLARVGPPAAQAEYLTHFRADAIVADAEHIRAELADDEPWTIFGQSYGGFCVTRYLSASADGVREALITGGLPPLGVDIDAIYSATFARMRERNAALCRRYPAIADVLTRIVTRLAPGDVVLPDGAPLTARRLQQIGLALGRSDGLEHLHALLETAFIAGDGDLSSLFLRLVMEESPYEGNPIYALLHEAAYCDGGSSDWSATRVMAGEPAFADAAMLTGEAIHPWMFEDYPALRPFAEAADLLARHEWPRLYDLDALTANAVPVAAAMYYEDMYVERAFSDATARLIPNVRTWVTNEYDHNGLRVNGGEIMDRLIGMVRGER